MDQCCVAQSKGCPRRGLGGGCVARLSSGTWAVVWLPKAVEPVTSRLLLPAALELKTRFQAEWRAAQRALFGRAAAPLCAETRSSGRVPHGTIAQRSSMQTWRSPALGRLRCCRRALPLPSGLWAACLRPPARVGQSGQRRCGRHARAGVARGPDGGLARRGAHDVAAAERLGGDAGGGGPPDAAHVPRRRRRRRRRRAGRRRRWPPRRGSRPWRRARRT